MTKSDDSSLSEQELANVIKHASKLLNEASALGRLPTPIDDLLAAAKVTVVEDEILDESTLRRLADKARASLVAGVTLVKTAFKKVLGLFDARDRIVILDKELHEARRPFVKLHEAGHGSLPHQTNLYALMHDCDMTLEDDIRDLFEREANVFASEVLFQGDLFRSHAADIPFGTKSAIKLAKDYGASNYSAFRRYVTTSSLPCCLVVVEPIALIGAGGAHDVRRILASQSFAKKFDTTPLAAAVGRGHPLKALMPYGQQRMVPERTFMLTDRNGNKRTLIGETFRAKQILMLFREKPGQN